MSGSGIATIATSAATATASNSRSTLRRKIARILNMKFFKSFENYSTCSTASTVSKVVDTNLTQQDDEWKNMYFYIAGDSNATSNVGAVRRITSFDAAGDALFLEYDLPAAPTAATQYEIHNIFSTFEIHQAINQAIAEAFPAFFDIISDESIVIREDTTDYSLSSLTYAPWIISSVWLEQPDESMTGTATAGAVDYITDDNANFTGVDTNWKISIYDGTGAGQLRSVGSLTGTTRVNPSVAFATAPDTTSKYRVWNPLEQSQKWYRVFAFHTDAGEYPSILYLTKKYPSIYGARIRLVYATQPIELTSETSTTVVPEEYVICRAVEMLAASRVANSRTDRDKWAVMEQMYRQRAETYRQRNSFHMPTTIQQEYDFSNPSSLQNEDWLDWGN